MRRVTATAVLFATVTFSSPAMTQAPLDIATVLKAYDLGDRSIQEKIEDRLLTMEDGIGWANAYMRGVRKTAPIYCLPEGFILTGRQLVDIVRRDSSVQPMLVGHGLIVALQRVFPCKE